MAQIAKDSDYGPQGSITSGPYGTLTFTDNQNFRVTIPMPLGATPTNPQNKHFHNYVKELSLNGLTIESARRFVEQNPTAHSFNNPTTPGGTPNDATPGFGYRQLLGGLAKALTPWDNAVHSYTAINELTGEPVVINVTDPSHILNFGAVIQIVRENPDGSISITR